MDPEQLPGHALIGIDAYVLPQAQQLLLGEAEGPALTILYPVLIGYGEYLLADLVVR